MNYSHIETAHPPKRDRMFYGLNRIAWIINEGVITNTDYFIKCFNFEHLLSMIYKGNQFQFFDLCQNALSKFFFNLYLC